MADPVNTSDLYDVIILGDAISPGKVRLSGHDRSVKWDIKDGSAQQGAGMSIKSIPPVEFTATFTLIVNPAEGLNEVAEWDDFQKVIDSTVNGPTVKAIDIYHPDLLRNEIRSVVKATVGGMTQDENDPSKSTVVVKFQEYRPPTKKSGSPSGSSAKKPDPKKPDPNAAANAELEALTKTYLATPWS